LSTIARDTLSQHWVHSHEEDTDTEMVFRPATYAFPRSRGRRGFELKRDGSLVESRIGPTDRPVKAEGTWRLEDEGTLTLSGEAPGGPPRVMRIASATPDRLVIKKARP
jgi:hypothetical protein